MKKLAWIAASLLLLILCACAKLPAQETAAPEAPVQSGLEAPDTAGAPAEEAAEAESFAGAEKVPAPSELRCNTGPAAGLSLINSRQYGPIAVSYYAALSEFDVWDAKQALFGTAKAEVPAQMDCPDDLGFEPFRTYPDPSGTYLLICKYEPAFEAEPPVYYLYDGTELSACGALNDCALGPVNLADVRWRGERALVYDAEAPETHRMTTYLYDVQTKTEQVLLADYDPFPFLAGDTASERYLLIHDTYALRVERGGAVFLRTLPDGAEKAVPGIQIPDTAYFHITALDQTTAVYFSVDEDGHYAALAFIDCGSGECAKLERSVPDGIQEQYPLPLSENTVAIPASSGTAENTQKYLFVYTFRGHAAEASSAQAPSEDDAAPAEDTAWLQKIDALVENARTGASYEYVYYDVCTTDDERAAFEDDIRTAKDAFRAYLAANREGFAWNQSENLQAQLSIYDDCSVSLQIYDGNLCAAEFRYLPDTGVSEVGA